MWVQSVSNLPKGWLGNSGLGRRLCSHTEVGSDVSPKKNYLFREKNTELGYSITFILHALQRRLRMGGKLDNCIYSSIGNMSLGGVMRSVSGF